MYKYHSTIPDSNKAYFSELDTVDFSLKYPGRKVVANSVRITGKVQLFAGPTQVVNPTDVTKVYMDGVIGAHSFFNNFVVSSDNLGMVELLNNYPRWVKAHSTATMDEDSFFNSSKVCEMRTARDYDTHALMLGEFESDYDTTTPTLVRQGDMDFYIKPDICLNNATGNMSFSKFNNMKVSVRMSRNVNALHGAGCDATTSYRIVDLKLHYVTIPDNGPEPVTMAIKYSISQGINTNQSIIQIKAPIQCDGVSVNFITQQDDNSQTANNHKLEDLPLLDEVQYEYNNAANSLVSFNIRNRPELDYFTEMGMKSLGVDNMSLAKLECNKSFMIAYGFPSQSLLNSQITINIKSGITTDYVAYVFLHGYLAF